MEETDETGTTITFWANRGDLRDVDYDFETIRARFQQMAFLNKGLRINLVDERVARRSVVDDEVDLDNLDGPDVEEASTRSGRATARSRSADQGARSYRYDGGLVDYVKHLVGSKKSDPIHPEIISHRVRGHRAQLSLELAMQWTTAYSESVHTYANTINTHEGGTHEEGFRAALTKLVNEFARKQGLLKDKDENLTGDDIREGLTASSRSSSASRSSRVRPRPSSATPRSRASSSAR
jgi:DNA gyrase subunit B